MSSVSTSSSLSFAVSSPISTGLSSRLYFCPNSTEPHHVNKFERGRAVLKRCTPRRKKWTPYAQTDSRLPPSTATIHHKKTGSTIHVIGCVHGSKVSASDVRTVISQTSPDAIVLELCEPRLKALHTMSKKTANGQTSRQIWREGTSHSFASLSQAYGGAGPALIAILLEAVYKIQAVAGIEPGIEFLEVINNWSSSKIVCGDASARDTVNNLFRVFASPFQSLRASATALQDLLQRLFFFPKGGVNTFMLILTQPARILELLQLLIPATILSVILGIFGTATASTLESSAAVTDFTGGTSAPVFGLLSNFSQTLLSVYLIFSGLHFMKVLILDRDRILIRNILETARNENNNGNSAPTICVVVGLLHVNGMVRLLNEENNID